MADWNLVLHFYSSHKNTSLLRRNAFSIVGWADRWKLIRCLLGKFYLDGTPAWLNVNSNNTLIFLRSKQGLFAAFFRYFLLVIKPIVISMLLSSSTCFILHSCSLTNNATDVDFVVKVYLIPPLIYLLKILYFNNLKSQLNRTTTPQSFSPWEEIQSCTQVIRSRSTKFTYLRWAYIKMWALCICKSVLSW